MIWMLGRTAFKPHGCPLKRSRSRAFYCEGKTRYKISPTSQLHSLTKASYKNTSRRIRSGDILFIFKYTKDIQGPNDLSNLRQPWFIQARLLLVAHKKTFTHLNHELSLGQFAMVYYSLSTHQRACLESTFIYKGVQTGAICLSF